MTGRLLAKMDQTAPLGHGWRHELEIQTPTTTFGTFPETPPLSQGEVIQWWTPPPYPERLSFHLYVGDAGSLASFGNHIGRVCQMQLNNGRRLVILAQSTPMPDSVGVAIQQHVASLPKAPNRVQSFTLFKRGDDVPILLDLAVLA